MVGLLSLMSITTTVSVAEPTRGGVPLSIAVTTKLQESTKAKQEGHNHMSGAVCTQHLEQEDAAHVHRLEHVVKLCTTGVHGAMDVYRASGAGQWMCTYQEHRMHIWVYIWRAVGFCPAPGAYEQAMHVGTSVWSIW